MARGPSPRAEAERRRPAAPPGDEPWMMEAEEEAGHTLIGRRTLLGLLIGLLLLVAIVAAGVWLISEKADGPIDVPPEGEVPLVRSPGPWKVDATGPGTEGQPVEGQGQLLFPTGEGLEPDAPLAVDRLPEEPVPPRAAPAGATAAGTAPETVRETGNAPPIPLLPEEEPVAAPPPQRAREAPPEPGRRPPPVPAPSSTPTRSGPAGSAESTVALGPVPPGPAPSGTVQLGAFSSEAAARKAWDGLAARFPWLADYAQSIVPVAREGGATLYRLRARGPDPEAACNRLRIAGEECALVR